MLRCRSVPWLLDLNFSATHRGKQVVDGNFSYSWLGQHTSLLPPSWVLSHPSHAQRTSKIPFADILARCLANNECGNSGVAGHRRSVIEGSASRHHDSPQRHSHNESSHAPCTSSISQPSVSQLHTQQSCSSRAATSTGTGIYSSASRSSVHTSRTHDTHHVKHQHTPDGGACKGPDALIQALLLDPRDDDKLQLHKSLQCYHLMGRDEAMAYVHMG